LELAIDNRLDLIGLDPTAPGECPQATNDLGADGTKGVFQGRHRRGFTVEVDRSAH
jgi:hypothetical protein